MKTPYRLEPAKTLLMPELTEGVPAKTRTILVNGQERTVRIFFPSDYDGTEKLPALITLHGNGGYRAERDTWFYTAQRCGFLVVYPEAKKETRWNIFDMKTGDGGGDDVTFLDAVQDYIIRDCHADEERIYLHGQSMGDNMASYYLFRHSGKIAAAALTSGPVLPTILYDSQGNRRYQPQNALPVARLHGENDTLVGLTATYGIPKPDIAKALEPWELEKLRRMMEDMQKEIWKEANQVQRIPQFYFDTQKNVEIYSGEQGNFLYYSIAGGKHRPNLDAYDMLWEEFLSGCHRKTDGKYRQDTPNRELKLDSSLIAIACGSDSYYRNGAVHHSMEKLSVSMIGDELYTSVGFLKNVLPEADLQLAEDGKQAVLSLGQKKLQIAFGHNLVLLNGHPKAAPVIRMEEGMLLIPAAVILPLLTSCHVQIVDQAAVFAEREFILTKDSAATIRQLLGTEPPFTAKNALALENTIQKKIKEYMNRR